jgi:hypothetical protein
MADQQWGTLMESRAQMTSSSENDETLPNAPAVGAASATQPQQTRLASGLMTHPPSPSVTARYFDSTTVPPPVLPPEPPALVGLLAMEVALAPPVPPTEVELEPELVSPTVTEDTVVVVASAADAIVPVTEVSPPDAV